MTVSIKTPDQGQTPADTGAGIAVASVWLVLYLAILVAVLVDHYPGAVVDVASAALTNLIWSGAENHAQSCVVVIY